MNDKNQQEDRYSTFVGLSCDANADRLITLLDDNINSGKGDSKWQAYFTKKRSEQLKLQHDNLNFIGHQTNTLYEYFATCADETAKSLLYKIEQQCC